MRPVQTTPKPTLSDVLRDELLRSAVWFAERRMTPVRGDPCPPFLYGEAHFWIIDHLSQFQQIVARERARLDNGGTHGTA